MSGWDQGQQQGFYNPDGSSFYGNYGAGNYDPSYMPTAPLDGVAPYGVVGEENYVDDEFANEPPLLEELGINPEYIFQKTLTVLNPFRATRADVAGDSDLAGPLVIQTKVPTLTLVESKVSRLNVQFEQFFIFCVISNVTVEVFVFFLQCEKLKVVRNMFWLFERYFPSA